MAKENYRYRAICHTKCYWLSTLWKPGDVYEGNFVPNKHFSKDGQAPDNTPVNNAAMDPRSNIELKEFLQKHGVRVHDHLKRKELWLKVREIETAADKDEMVVPSKDAIEIKKEPVEKPKVRRGRKKKDD